MAAGAFATATATEESKNIQICVIVEQTRHELASFSSGIRRRNRNRGFWNHSSVCLCVSGRLFQSVHLHFSIQHLQPPSAVSVCLFVCLCEPRCICHANANRPTSQPTTFFMAACRRCSHRIKKNKRYNC